MAKQSKNQASEPKSKRQPLKSVAKPFKSAARPLKPVGRVTKKAGHYVIPPYFRNSWAELKLVTWPNWNLARQLTVAVIIFAVIFAILLGVVDYGLNAAFKALFLK